MRGDARLSGAACCRLHAPGMHVLAQIAAHAVLRQHLMRMAARPLLRPPPLRVIYHHVHHATPARTASSTHI
eukprot:602752-Pleurochrysis_carterae.AAC.1